VSNTASHSPERKGKKKRVERRGEEEEERK
jgi:hypothetical protein